MDGQSCNMTETHTAYLWITEIIEIFSQWSLERSKPYINFPPSPLAFPSTSTIMKSYLRNHQLFLVVPGWISSTTFSNAT